MKCKFCNSEIEKGTGLCTICGTPSKEKKLDKVDSTINPDPFSDDETQDSPPPPILPKSPSCAPWATNYGTQNQSNLNQRNQSQLHKFKQSNTNESISWGSLILSLVPYFLVILSWSGYHTAMLFFALGISVFAVIVSVYERRNGKPLATLSLILSIISIAFVLIAIVIWFVFLMIEWFFFNSGPDLSF
ncbi:MAG: hypothetical protein FWC82_01620 [Firmicutes bacterium]|nr:hypothetical protein [Bacillota bacterium]